MAIVDKQISRKGAKAQRIRQRRKNFEQELTEETENEHLFIPLLSLFSPVQLILLSLAPLRE
jgi:hypothetical protein